MHYLHLRRRIFSLVFGSVGPMKKRKSRMDYVLSFLSIATAASFAVPIARITVQLGCDIAAGIDFFDVVSPRQFTGHTAVSVSGKFGQHSEEKRVWSLTDSFDHYIRLDCELASLYRIEGAASVVPACQVPF